MSQGVITAKGSIFVNGIEYSTAQAAIKIDDSPKAESDLKVGMVARVRGFSDDVARTGTAFSVEVRDRLEGTISAIDAANNTLTVMGQSVRIEDNVTRLNDDDTQKTFAAAGFAVDDRVEVNGFPDDNGGLRATRVARKLTGEFEVKGFVTGLNTSSFGLSPAPGGAATLTVNFPALLLPAGTANGTLVEVKSALAPVAGAITATFIKVEDALGAVGERVEVEGFVTSGTLASFVVNGQTVTTSSATLYEGGSSADFAIGSKLEAEGTLDAGGTLLASKIVFRANVRIVADASGVSASGLTVLGKSVAITPFTRVDGVPANGAHVEVRAYLDRDGNLVAERVVVQGADTKAFLQAPVSVFSSAAGTMTLLGVGVISDGSTEWRVSTDGADLAVTAANFFARLNPGVTVVKVRWDNFSATTAPIKQAEIQLGH